MSGATQRPDGPDKSRSLRRWSRLIGVAIGLAGIAFVVRAVVRDWDEVSRAISEANPWFLVLALALGGVAMTGIGLAWHTSLRALGTRLSLVDSMRGYFVGQLGKYVPGGVWAIMGRGEWARSGGVPGALAYTSVLLSMGTAYLAALTLTAILLPLSGFLEADDDARYLLVLLLLPIGFALLVPRILERIFTLLRRLTSRELEIVVPRWRTSVLIVLQQVPSWVLIGLVSVAIAAGLGGSADALNLIWATAVAWIVGFIALPTPGGIGVREAVFVALASSLPVGIGATVAVVSRLVFIAVDATGAGVTSLVVSRQSPRAGVKP